MNISSQLQLYVINLDSNLERRESLVYEGSKVGLKLVRVSAVLASDLNETDENCVSSGVRAAWLSHLKAMQYFLESDAEFAIIAEDDFQVVNTDKLHKYLEKSSTYDFDLIQFGFLKTGIDIRIRVLVSNLQLSFFKAVGVLSRVKLLGRFDLSGRMRVSDALRTPSGLVPFDCEPGAHFYLISRFLASEMVKLNNPQFLSIDDFFTALAKMRAFKMARMRNSIVSQKDFQPWSGERFKSRSRKLA